MTAAAAAASDAPAAASATATAASTGETTRHVHARPVAWRARAGNRPSPRLYVYDLPAAWRLGPQLLSEYDHALTERLLISPHREADPARADYFWITGARRGGAADGHAPA
eukprot:969473-Prymnesium_polylepis.1